MNMPIKIFRCPHHSDELNENFEKEFKECDIFLFEQGCNDEYNRVKSYISELSAKGYSSDSTPLIGNFDAYMEKLLNIIKNSKKKIEVEKSPFAQEYTERNESFGDNAMKRFCSGDIERACADMIMYLTGVNERDEGRENSLEEQLIQIQEENKDKKVLAAIGTDHLIYYKLKNKGLDVKQEFSYMPVVYPIHAEVKRRIAFNKLFTMEMVAKSIAESFITKFLISSGATSREIIEIPRKLLEKLDYEKIKELSKYMSEDVLRRRFPNEAVVIWLRKQGFEI